MQPVIATEFGAAVPRRPWAQSLPIPVLGSLPLPATDVAQAHTLPFAAPFVPPIHPGVLVGGRYQIAGRLGTGGMAVVYRAIDLVLAGAVALKVPGPALEGRPAAYERLVREVRLGRRLSHPAIVRVHDLGQHEGVPFMVMEYIPGETLESLCLRLGGLTAAELLPVMAQLTAALDAVHAAGIVHCDLKPANVLVGAGGRIALADFGVSCDLRPAGAEGAALPSTSSGTPSYMAPEQIVGERVDARADIYALGATLYELLTGEPPWTGKTCAMVLSARFREPPPDPRHRCPGLPAALADLVRRCLSLSIGERPTSAGAVYHELRQALAGGGALATWRHIDGAHALTQGHPPGRALVPATL